jgi:exodeoxyribonuclease VII large subunit
MSPANVLKRGYSITLLNGKSVTNISQINNGDILNTIVHKGNIVSIVNSTHKNKK